MIICGKYVITGDGVTVLENAGIMVNKDGKIEKIGTKEELLLAYPKEEIKEYKDGTILPGLFDMHIHLGYWFSQPDRIIYDEQLISYFTLKHAQDALAKGVTNVRDLGSPTGVCKNLKIAGEKGFVTIPHITQTDAGICMTGGHGWDDDIDQQDGPWNIRSTIRKHLRNGADWIKVLTSHRSHIPEFTQEELDAAVDECHRRDIKCAVHAGTHPAIQMCIDAGFDTIEHGTFMTVEQAKQMKEKGIAWIPTIMAYVYLYEICKKNIESGNTTTFSDPVAAKEQRDYYYFEPAYIAYRDNFKALYDTGVTVCAGSDMVMFQAPVVPIPEELGYMVEYGITPLQAIQTATSNPAKVLGKDKETGSIKEGLNADILVVEGDVSTDIKKIADVQTVFLDGKIVFDNGVRFL